MFLNWRLPGMESTVISNALDSGGIGDNIIRVPVAPPELP